MTVRWNSIGAKIAQAARPVLMLLFALRAVYCTGRIFIYLIVYKK